MKNVSDFDHLNFVAFPDLPCKSSLKKKCLKRGIKLQVTFHQYVYGCTVYCFSSSLPLKTYAVPWNQKATGLTLLTPPLADPTMASSPMPHSLKWTSATAILASVLRT